jgi:hypothetical protein
LPFMSTSILSISTVIVLRIAYDFVGKARSRKKNKKNEAKILIVFFTTYCRFAQQL